MCTKRADGKIKRIVSPSTMCILKISASPATKTAALHLVQVLLVGPAGGRLDAVGVVQQHAEVADTPDTGFGAKFGSPAPLAGDLADGRVDDLLLHVVHHDHAFGHTLALHRPCRNGAVRVEQYL